MKPGEIEYDFSELDQDEEFQKFLRWRPAPGKIEEIDIEKCEEGMRKFNEHFLRPLLETNQRKRRTLIFRVDDPDDAMIEVDMGFRQSRIPPKERCPECDGKGSIRIGGPPTRSNYATCINCSGTGLKSKYEEVKKTLESLEKE